MTDNASTNDLVAMVREHFPVRLIASREIWASRPEQRALAAAAGVLMMLNRTPRSGRERSNTSFASCANVLKPGPWARAW